MSKLDEIEEIVNTPGEPWPDMYEELRLLIRAVRQFSNLDVHMMGRAKALKEGLLDPDVLELLEESE